MSTFIEDKVLQLPIIREIVKWTKSVKLPFLEGMLLYDLLELYIKGMWNGAFSYRAGSIAFSFFLALFPFALFLLNLIPYIPIENFQINFLHFIESSVPPNTYGAIEKILIDITNTSYNSLLSTGGIMTLIFMANGMYAIISGLEASYHITTYRNFFNTYLLAILLSVGFSLILLLSIALYLTVEVYLHITNYPLLLKLGRYAFLAVLTFVIISILYKIGTKQIKKLSFVSYGSIFTTLLIGLSSNLFSIYVLKFSKYNELYGSIGTLLVLMVYIWINCIILLLGFELNATIFALKKKQESNEIFEKKV